MVSTYITRQLLKYTQLQTIINIGSKILLTASILVIITWMLHYLNVAIIASLSFVAVIGAGMVLSNTFVMAFAELDHDIGLAGALYGTLQILCTMLVSIFIAYLHFHNQLGLGIALIAIGTIIFGLQQITSLPNKTQAQASGHTTV